MHAWEQIQESIEFIESHLGEELSIRDLAEKAALSPFYYQRLFRRLVKQPAAEYISCAGWQKQRRPCFQRTEGFWT